MTTTSRKFKVKKMFWEKKKSKFLFFRPELQVTPNYSVSGSFITSQRDKVRKNRIRRSKLKINQNPHPKSYYADCYVNSAEYKNR